MLLSMFCSLAAGRLGSLSMQPTAPSKSLSSRQPGKAAAKPPRAAGGKKKEQVLSSESEAEGADDALDLSGRCAFSSVTPMQAPRWLLHCRRSQ